MKRLLRTRHFKKLYKNLSDQIKKKTNRKLELLAEDYLHPNLSTKKMVNQPDVWEARIDSHYRMTFTVTSQGIILRAVGTHRIYKNP